MVGFACRSVPEEINLLQERHSTGSRPHHHEREFQPVNEILATARSPTHRLQLQKTWCSARTSGNTVARWCTDERLHWPAGPLKRSFSSVVLGEEDGDPKGKRASKTTPADSKQHRKSEYVPQIELSDIFVMSSRFCSFLEPAGSPLRA